MWVFPLFFCTQKCSSKFLAKTAKRKRQRVQNYDKCQRYQNQMLRTMRNIKMSEWCVFYDMFYIYTLTISIYIASDQPDKHIVSVCMLFEQWITLHANVWMKLKFLMLDIILLIILHIQLDILYRGDTLFIGYCCHLVEYMLTLWSISLFWQTVLPCCRIFSSLFSEIRLIFICFVHELEIIQLFSSISFLF